MYVEREREVIQMNRLIFFFESPHQRKKTLLKEYEQKGRTGGIIDRRFGENDPTMSLEERMLERFTKERQRSSRGNAFNLENDEDDLTHYGQSLSKLDDFDNVGLRIDSDEEETSGIHLLLPLCIYCRYLNLPLQDSLGER